MGEAVAVERARLRSPRRLGFWTSEQSYQGDVRLAGLKNRRALTLRFFEAPRVLVFATMPATVEGRVRRAITGGIGVALSRKQVRWSDRGRLHTMKGVRDSHMDAIVAELYCRSWAHDAGTTPHAL